jgi:hypothetical protein
LKFKPLNLGGMLQFIKIWKLSSNWISTYKLKNLSINLLVCHVPVSVLALVSHSGYWTEWILTILPELLLIFCCILFSNLLPSFLWADELLRMVSSTSIYDSFGQINTWLLRGFASLARVFLLNKWIEGSLIE